MVLGFEQGPTCKLLHLNVKVESQRNRGKGLPVSCDAAVPEQAREHYLARGANTGGPLLAELRHASYHRRAQELCERCLCARAAEIKRLYNCAYSP
jgi:hypothetical protein